MEKGLYHLLSLQIVDKKMPKITVVGAGNLGSQSALYLAINKIADVVLIDVVDGLAQGKALDMLQAMPILGSGSNIVGGTDYALSKDSDIVIITAGIPRKPGMTREELLEVNSNIMRSIVPNVVENSPDSILIIVSNPLDAMVHLAHKLSGFSKQRVIGMAGVLDTARMKAFIAEELDENINDVEAMVLGSHGDLMIPLIDQCKVKGKKLNEVMDKEKIESIIQRTRDGGAEIVGLLKTGSAFFAPGIAAASMAESIIKDQKKVMPCAALLEEEYDVEGVFMGVPVKLGKNGAEEIIELELSEEEKKEFMKCVEHVRSLCKEL